MNSKHSKSTESGMRVLKIKQEPPDTYHTPESSQLFQPSRPSEVFSSSLYSYRVKSEPGDSLTGLIRLHKLNLTKQKILEHEISRIQSYIPFVQKKVALCKQVINEEKQRSDVKPMTQIRAISVFAAPYFRDQKKMVPPPNEDTLIKRKSHDVNAYLAPPKPWTPEETKKLLDGVTSYALMSALLPLKRDLDYIRRKMKNGNTTDEQLEELKQELFICQGKIRLVRAKHLVDLLAELDGNIDWMTVSASNMEGIRSPEECEIMWNNVVSFDINKEKFSKEEDDKLVYLAEEYDERNWDVIAEKLMTRRTAIQCFERYQTKLNLNLKKKFWTEEEDKRLLDLIEEHRCGGVIPWNKLALMMEGRTRQQLINRYERSISQKDNRYPWSPEEDGLLIACYQKFGTRWNKMGDFFKRRSTYVIRERYCNALTPNIRAAQWSKEEDKILISLIRKYGYGQWAKICKGLSGRTDNMCLIRAGRLLEWSMKYHKSKNTGLYDPNRNDPEMYAQILRPCAPSKYCPLRNEKLKSYRINGLKMLDKALEGILPDHKAGIKDLNDIDVSWMSSILLHRLSDILHAHLEEREKQGEKPGVILKYITKPILKRKRGAPEPEYDEPTIHGPFEEDDVVPRDEKELIDSALLFMFDTQCNIMPTSERKTLNLGSRQSAEMSLYKAYLYKQFQCKALCDPDDDLENVVFAKVDYRTTLQTVVSYFIQPPVYDNQFIILEPNMTTMLGLEAVQSTENRLLEMSLNVSHSKPYLDYLCEKRKSCPKCLQCLYGSNRIASSCATPQSVMDEMKKKYFLLDKRTEENAYIEGACIEKLSNTCCCKELADSQKSVQLLRKRLLSLFLWPSFLSSFELSEKQEQIITSIKNNQLNLPEGYYPKRKRSSVRQARQKRISEPLTEGDPEENYPKRKRSMVRQPRQKRKSEPLTERDPGNPNPEVNGDPNPEVNLDPNPEVNGDPNPELNAEAEPNPKRRKRQSKVSPHENKVSKKIVRKSNRSCVLNRTSFAPEGIKKRKTLTKISNTSFQSQSDLLETSLNDLPSSSHKENNLSQLRKQRKCDSSSEQKKKSIRKGRKSAKKSEHDLSVSELISHDMQSSDHEVSNSSQLRKENVCNTSSVQKKGNTPAKISNTLSDIHRDLLEAFLNDLPPSDNEDSNSSQLPKQTKRDSSSVQKKKNTCKSHKSVKKSEHELLESKVTSHDIQSSDHGISNLSQLPKENVRNTPSVQKKRNTSAKIRNTLSKSQNDSLETFLNDFPPSNLENSDSSQLSKESKWDSSTVLKKKRICNSRKSVKKSENELSVSEMTAFNMQSLDHEVKNSESNRNISTEISNTLSESQSDLLEAFVDDSAPPYHEDINSPQLTKQKECVSSLVQKKKNIRKSRKSAKETEHKLLLSHDVPSSDSGVSSSPNLPEKNRYNVPSVQKKGKAHKSRKSEKKTDHKSSESEVNSHDLSPSIHSIPSQLLEENVCDVSSIPEKKNIHNSHESKQKTNNETSASEIHLNDASPIYGESCSSSLSTEINQCNVLILPEKRNKCESDESVEKDSHEISVSGVLLNDTTPTADRTDAVLTLEKQNNKMLQLLDEIRTRAAPEERKNNAALVQGKKENYLSTFLDKIKNKVSGKSEKNKSITSVLQDKTENDTLSALDEIKSDALGKPTENKDKDSVSHSKQENCVNGNLEVQGEMFQEQSLDGASLSPEDNKGDGLIIQNEDKASEKDIVILSAESVEECDVYLSEDNNTSPLALQDTHSDSIVDILEERSDDSSAMLDENIISPDCIMSPPEEIITSPPSYLDRSSDSVLLLEERNKNAFKAEEIIISSDSSVSYDQYHDSESEVKGTHVNCELELSEKNMHVT